MNHDLRIRKNHALPLRAAGEEEGPHRGRHTHTDGGDIAFDILHRIVDRHAGRDHPARGIDIKADILVRIL